jgi:hypothetical protein
MPTGDAFERLDAAIFDDEDSENKGHESRGHKIESRSATTARERRYWRLSPKTVGVSTDHHGGTWVDTDAAGEARMAVRFVEGLSVVDASIIPVFHAQTPISRPS